MDPYLYYQQQAPEALLASTEGYPYDQYAVPRSKTPTSLLNHTGHSPGGPLSTPPPMSRNASRGPDVLPGPFPEQLVYDGSESNSPTSVRTPENDIFEMDMVDSPMREFYHGNGVMGSTQSPQAPLPAIDNSLLLSPQDRIPDQVLREAFDATMATRPQFHAQLLPVQNRLPSNLITPQAYQTYLSPAFTDQTAPWTSEGPPRNPHVPGPAIAVFDPAFDNVNIWRTNYTDPASLLSPNEPPMIPPQDFFSLATESLIQAHQPAQTFPTQHHVSGFPYETNSIEMTFPQASPSENPNDSMFNQASYSMATQQQPSPVAASIELPTMRTVQLPTSPMASASSPGGSDGIFSSYQSDTGAEGFKPYSQQSFNLTLSPSASFNAGSSPIRASFSPSTALDVSPEPETKPRRQVGPIRTANRPGGRALGTHLEPKVAKAAHDMRKIVACWHCVLQRDKCGPGDDCERCVKRAQRPNADCGLGCSRIKLVELSDFFLPTLVMQIHEDSHLTHFVSQFIHQWGNQEINVWLTCEQRTMPRIQVKVYEFAPRGEELLVQLQYQTNPVTQERYTIKKRSPALGMVHINHNEEKKYDKYLNDIVDNHLDAFADICWAEDDNDFSPRLLKLMTRVKPKSDEEAKLLREVFRLIVCTYIMSHTITIAEETKKETLSKLHGYTDPAAYVQNYTSPRMTARQLKYFFARLQRNTLNNVLNKLQQIFKSSRGCDKWLAAFVAVVGMAMAQEDQQKTIHQVMSTRAATENLDPRDAQAKAEIANREVDQRMNFVSQIFRWKYNRKVNPLRDCDEDWEKETGFGDESSVTFVRSVAQLVKENIDYLQKRQAISVAASNQGLYTSRLVAPFLLSFWLPQ